MVKNPPKIEIPAPRRLGVGSWWVDWFFVDHWTDAWVDSSEGLLQRAPGGWTLVSR